MVKPETRALEGAAPAIHVHMERGMRPDAQIAELRLPEVAHPPRSHPASRIAIRLWPTCR